MKVCVSYRFQHDFLSYSGFSLIFNVFSRVKCVLQCVGCSPICTVFYSGLQLRFRVLSSVPVVMLDKISPVFSVPGVFPSQDVLQSL